VSCFRGFRRVWSSLHGPRRANGRGLQFQQKHYKFSSGIVEGWNYKIKLTFRKAYGFKTLNAAPIALDHALGQLPEPELTHECC